MSGYNRLEQVVGSALSRVPRVKSAVETVYQRMSYHVFADSDFEYNLHDDAEIYSAREWAGLPERDNGQFVGFYDVCPWNESMSGYLVHEIENHQVSITLLQEGKATEIATTNAWNYQQGSRLQWHPTHSRELVFNDIDAGSAVAKVVNTDGEILRTYPHPIQAVSPTGEEFLSVNYRRYDCNSPAYGYGTDDDPELPNPSDDGILRVESDGATELLIPFSELIESNGSAISHDNHYIHHSLYSPDGKRFAFLHRWMDGERRNTRLIVSDRDGNWRVLLTHPDISHFCWIDSRRLFFWGRSEEFGRGYHIADVRTSELTYVDALEGYGDGHPSISPDGEWIVTDTYPDRTRKRTVWLYHLRHGDLFKLGEFFAPFNFSGRFRCDLHPRWSPDSRYISVDSAHEGIRNSYVVDVNSIR